MGVTNHLLNGMILQEILHQSVEVDSLPHYFKTTGFSTIAGGLVVLYVGFWAINSITGNKNDNFPDAPCREYLPTFPFQCGNFSPNVGK